MRIDLIDDDLFGNEAGEDEPIEILNSYYLEKEEYKKFYSESRRLAFVRSRKGIGKSALLKKTLYRRHEIDNEDIFIFVKASELIALQDLNESNIYECVNGWQQRICSRISVQIGKQTGFAFRDDSISLVESSELAGFKEKNIIGALISRLKLKLDKFEIMDRPNSIPSAEPLITRYLSGKDKNVWIFIDDIDSNFKNSKLDILTVSSFFTACRNLVNNVNGLYIRASVRTDVWSILVNNDEDLDKCEQYMMDIKWSISDTGKIIENKIISYFVRHYPENKYYQRLFENRNTVDIYNLVFYGGFHWGKYDVPPYQPIHSISAGRPRWSAQLCKLAAKDAYRASFNTISKANVNNALREYGQFRLSDLYKEYGHQCRTLKDIIEAFSGGMKNYTTKQLLYLINSKIIMIKGKQTIDEKVLKENDLQIAKFLYRIDFISLRNENNNGSLDFVKYEDRPDLLSTTVNLDDGNTWEIHTSYRSVLRIGKDYIF